MNISINGAIIDRKKVKKVSLLFSLIILLLSGCGYRFGKGELIAEYQSITIPYVAGDDDGFFSAELIRRFSETGTLCLSNCNGELILDVCLFEPDDENIGYIYARNEDEELTKKVVSHEGRLSISAKVTVREAATGACLLGPCEIDSFLDFDFEPDLATFEDHEFALGQLEMHPLAIDAAMQSLYERLAQKIVDYVIHSW